MKMSSRRRLGVSIAGLLAGSTLALGGSVVAAGADDGPSTETPTVAATEPTSDPTSDPTPDPTSDPTSDPTDSTAEATTGSTEPAAEPSSEPTREPADETTGTAGTDDAGAGEVAPSTEPSTEPSTGKDAVVRAAPQAVPGCPRPGGPQQIPAVDELELNDQSGTVIGPGNTVGAWELLDVQFSGDVPAGSCAGDQVVIDLPDGFTGGSGTFPVLAPDGSSMGTMVVERGVVTITFNDYVENHDDVTFEGFFEVRIDNSYAPGGEYTVDFPINGEAYPITFPTGPCGPECGNPDGNSGKSAGYLPGDPQQGDDEIIYHLNSRRALQAGEVITITDRLGPGQRFQCDDQHVQLSTRNDAWNVPVFGAFIEGTRPDITIVCSDTQVTMTVTAQAVGEMYRLVGYSDVTDFTLAKYEDFGEVNQNGVTDEVRASTTASTGGASGSGTGRKPAIDIEKWSAGQDDSAGGPVVHTPRADETGAGFPGDFDVAPGRLLDADESVQVTFTVKNTGNEDLRDVVVSDVTDRGVALTGLTCDFSPLGGPASGTTWPEGPFKVGASFTCTATLPALGGDARHADTASVTGVGIRSGRSVTDQDLWHAWTGVVDDETPSEPPTPTEPPTEPTEPPTEPTQPPTTTNPYTPPTPPSTSSDLPDTGAGAGLMGAGVLGLLLLLGGAFLVRHRRGGVS